jgi:hypothetical protein
LCDQTFPLPYIGSRDRRIEIDAKILENHNLMELISKEGEKGIGRNGVVWQDVWQHVPLLGVV